MPWGGACSLALRWTAVTGSLQPQHPLYPQPLSPGQPWPMSGHGRKPVPGRSVQQGTPPCPGAPCVEAQTSSELHGYLRLLLPNLPFSHLSSRRCQTCAWPGDLCTLSSTVLSPMHLLHFHSRWHICLPEDKMTQERLQRLTHSRGPTASHGQVFSASLGVHSCEIARFVFSLPPLLWL